MFAAGFYLAIGWMLEGQEARRPGSGDGLILEHPAFHEISNHHLNSAGV